MRQASGVMEHRLAVLGSRLERQRSERQHGLPQPTAREVRGTHAAPPADATDRSRGASGATGAPDRAGANLADPAASSPADEMEPRFFTPGSR